MFQYETCCVHSTAELIDALQESAEEITFDEFAAHVDGLGDFAQNMGYVGVHRDTYEDGQKGSGGLLLKDDWHIEYNSGVYDGRECYYLVHSRIEHIWT